jgi:hypothetical protein
MRKIKLMASETTEMANLISAFVEERVDEPRKEEVDLWCEAIYAALFSVAFEIQMALISQSKSSNQFDSELNNLVGAITQAASLWMESKIKKSWGLIERFRMSVDVSAHLKERLVMYFDEAFSVIENRDYDFEQARSHAVFGISSQALIALSFKGINLSSQDMKEVMTKIMETCNSFSSEIREVIYRRRH